MAIKILKLGVNPKDLTYRTECLVCKSILEFKTSDATMVPGSDRHYSGDFLHLECPVCEAHITHYI